MQNIIKPQTLKGFRDFLPADMKARQKVFGVFRKVFEKYGYEPLETPALEYEEVLLGKYGEEAEKLIYKFKDRGGRGVAMKYDLTVPAARVFAQYQNILPIPFKRYQIQPVWRADNTQKGRFREFYQCDADSLGTSSMLADGEFIQMCTDLFKSLGFNEFTTRVNNRKVTNALVKYASGQDKDFLDIVTSIDKLEKIGVEGVKGELTQRGIPQEAINKILDLIKMQGTTDELLNIYKEKLASIPEAVEGLDELSQIFDYLKSCKIPEKFYKFDPFIVRGLAYYTGPVWETVILEGNVGSVTGCGRYDKLIGLYTGKDVPASGGSFGAERIIEVMKDRDMLSNQKVSHVLVTIFNKDLEKTSIDLANKLRGSEINTELYLDPTARLDKQLKYADKKGIPFVIIIGPDEASKNTVQLKNLSTKEQKEIKIEEITKYVCP